MTKTVEQVNLQVRQECYPDQSAPLAWTQQRKLLVDDLEAVASKIVQQSTELKDETFFLEAINHIKEQSEVFHLAGENLLAARDDAASESIENPDVWFQAFAQCYVMLHLWPQSQEGYAFKNERDDFILKTNAAACRFMRHALDTGFNTSQPGISLCHYVDASSRLLRTLLSQKESLKLICHEHEQKSLPQPYLANCETSIPDFLLDCYGMLYYDFFGLMNYSQQRTFDDMSNLLQELKTAEFTHTSSIEERLGNFKVRLEGKTLKITQWEKFLEIAINFLNTELSKYDIQNTEDKSSKVLKLKRKYALKPKNETILRSTLDQYFCHLSAKDAKEAVLKYENLLKSTFVGTYVAFIPTLIDMINTFQQMLSVNDHTHLDLYNTARKCLNLYKEKIIGEPNSLSSKIIKEYFSYWDATLLQRYREALTIRVEQLHAAPTPEPVLAQDLDEDDLARMVSTLSEWCCPSNLAPLDYLDADKYRFQYLEKAGQAAKELVPVLQNSKAFSQVVMHIKNHFKIFELAGQDISTITQPFPEALDNPKTLMPEFYIGLLLLHLWPKQNHEFVSKDLRDDFTLKINAAACRWISHCNKTYFERSIQSKTLSQDSEDLMRLYNLCYVVTHDDLYRICTAHHKKQGSAPFLDNHQDLMSTLMFYMGGFLKCQSYLIFEKPFQKSLETTVANFAVLNGLGLANPNAQNFILLQGLIGKQHHFNQFYMLLQPQILASFSTFESKRQRDQNNIPFVILTPRSNKNNPVSNKELNKLLQKMSAWKYTTKLKPKEIENRFEKLLNAFEQLLLPNRVLTSKLCQQALNLLEKFNKAVFKRPSHPYEATFLEQLSCYADTFRYHLRECVLKEKEEQPSQLKTASAPAKGKGKKKRKVTAAPQVLPASDAQEVSNEEPESILLASIEQSNDPLDLLSQKDTELNELTHKLESLSLNLEASNQDFTRATERLKSERAKRKEIKENYVEITQGLQDELSNKEAKIAQLEAELNLLRQTLVYTQQNAQSSREAKTSENLEPSRAMEELKSTNQQQAQTITDLLALVQQSTEQIEAANKVSEKAIEAEQKAQNDLVSLQRQFQALSLGAPVRAKQVNPVAESIKPVDRFKSLEFKQELDEGQTVESIFEAIKEMEAQLLVKPQKPLQGDQAIARMMRDMEQNKHHRAFILGDTVRRWMNENDAREILVITTLSARFIENNPKQGRFQFQPVAGSKCRFRNEQHRITLICHPNLNLENLVDGFDFNVDAKLLNSAYQMIDLMDDNAHDLKKPEVCILGDLTRVPSDPTLLVQLMTIYCEQRWQLDPRMYPYIKAHLGRLDSVPYPVYKHQLALLFDKGHAVDALFLARNMNVLTELFGLRYDVIEPIFEICRQTANLSVINGQNPDLQALFLACSYWQNRGILEPKQIAEHYLKPWGTDWGSEQERQLEVESLAQRMQTFIKLIQEKCPGYMEEHVAPVIPPLTQVKGLYYQKDEKKLRPYKELTPAQPKTPEPTTPGSDALRKH